MDLRAALALVDGLLVSEPANQSAHELRREIVDRSLRKLARTGFASWGGGKPKGSNPRIRITPGPPVSDYVIEDRQ